MGEDRGTYICRLPPSVDRSCKSYHIADTIQSTFQIAHIDPSRKTASVAPARVTANDHAPVTATVPVPRVMEEAAKAVDERSPSTGTFQRLASST
jgi:hypothetical protein